MALKDNNLSKLNQFYQHQCELQNQLNNGDDNFRKLLIQNCLNKNLSGKEPIYFPDFEKGLEWLNTPKPLSVNQDLSNQIVILDFFTYCCINCLHILPTLKQLEQKLKDSKKVSIIGIHSAKFENEKITSQVKEAALRYSVDHPIVCDSKHQIWNQLNISCWPTVLILGPDSRLLFQLVGEFTINSWLLIYCEVILNHFYPSQFQLWDWLSLPKSNFISNQASTELRYPGKVEISPNGKLIAIADSGNNRIVIVFLNGIVQYLIGANSNGDFEDATFNNPQGLAWLTNEILFVADTGNNCLKKIDLINLKVEIILKDGDNKTFKLTSPWDLCLVDNNKLFIAIAGSHQIAALCLSDDCSLFNSNYTENTSVLVAGNGHEENRNNFYRLKAGFAQPSGIAYSSIHKALFIADSESSSVRQLNLKTGAVKNLAGANINPLDLFDYGDKDGNGLEVKFEHPLGLAYNHHNQDLLLADTYNHKIKLITIDEKKCSTLSGDKMPGNEFNCDVKKARFNEPSDISVHPFYKFFLIADTNNHCIKQFNLETNTINRLDLNFDKYFKLNFLNIEFDVNREKLITIETQKLSLLNSLNINLNLKFEESISFNSNAPNLVEINLPEKCHLRSSIRKYSLYVLDNPLIFTLKPISDDVENLRQIYQPVFSIQLLLKLLICSKDKGLCWMAKTEFTIPCVVDAKECDTAQKVVNIDCLINKFSNQDVK